MSNRVLCREASHAGSWYTASGASTSAEPIQIPRASSGENPKPTDEEQTYCRLPRTLISATKRMVALASRL